MNSPRSPKSPKTPRSSTSRAHGSGSRNSESFRRKKTTDPMDDPSLGGEEVANPEDALYKTYSKTIRAAEKALENAKEGGFDPSLRKPRKSRQSSLLKSPKSSNDTTNRFTRNYSLSNFSPTRASMLQQAQMADDVPNSSFDTTENVKLILKERRKLNEERKTVEDRLNEIRSEILLTQEEKDKKRIEQFDKLEREIDSISGSSISAPPSADHSLASSASATHSDVYKIGTNNETFEEVFERAMHMRDRSDDRTSDYRKQQDLLEQEKDWLSFEPDTSIWKKMKERINSKLEGKVDPTDEIRLSDDQVSNYIKAGEETDILREKEANVVRKERVAKAIRNEIVSEVVDVISTTIARFMWNVGRTVAKEIKDMLFKILLERDENYRGEGKPTPQETGALQLLQGHLEEERKRMHNQFVETFGEEWASNGLAPKGLSVSRSRLVYRNPSGELMPGRPVMMPKQKTDKNISLMESLNALSHEVDQKPLIALEKHFWEGVQLNLMKQGGLKPVLGIKYVTCCRIFPMPRQRYSDLAVGYKSGRFTITSIPWSPKFNAVTTVVSRSLSSSRDQCDVVDMKQGGGRMFVTMDIRGNIRVYTLTTGESEGSSSKFFVDPMEQYSPISPICVSIYKAEHFMFPIPDVLRPLSNPKTAKNFEGGPYDQQLRKLYEDVYSEKAATYRGTPTCVCFHPSMTASGRQVSIVAGLKGGSMVKMNIDSDVPALAAPIVYPKEAPFVEYEYCNPKVAKPEYLLASGDNSKPGNRVTRELFHFHRSQVLFVDVVKCISDTLISMDASGTIALWKYSPDYFNGYYRFVPSTTAKVDMSWLMFEAIDEGKGEDIVDAPSSDLEAKLVRSNYVSNKGVSFETFQPVTLLTEDGGGDKLVIYKRTEIPSHAVKRDKDGDVIALDTLLAGISILDEKIDSRKHQKNTKVIYDGRALASEKVIDVQRSDAGSFYTIDEGDEREQDDGKDTQKSNPATKLASAAAKFLKKSPEKDSERDRQLQSSSSSSMSSLHSTMSGKHIVGGVVPPSVLAAAPSSSSLSSSTSSEAKSSSSKISIFEGKTEGTVCIWEAQQVRRLPKAATFFGAKMSPDGLVVVILVLFSKRNTSATSQEDTDTGAFVTIDATTMQFKAPYPMFELARRDIILDFQVGPITKETLTRNVFLCSSSGGLRGFSLTTGEEILNSSFPFQAKHPAEDKIKSAFKYALFSMCQSQRIMVCKGGKESKSLLVFRFEDTGIRADNIGIQEERAAAYKCYSEEEREIVKAYAVSTSERVIMDEDDEARKLSEELYEAYIGRIADIEAFVKELIDDIFTYMDHVIDEREETDRMNKDRSKLLKDVYGLERYGVIEPTVWPPESMDKTLRKKHYEVMQMAIDKASEDSGDNSAGVSKVSSRSDITFERMKVEKSREKLVMGATTGEDNVDESNIND